jgi:hypothetical protein
VSSNIVGLPGHDGRDVGVAAGGDEKDAKVLHTGYLCPSQKAQANDTLKAVVQQHRAANPPFVAQPAFYEHEYTSEHIRRGREQLRNPDTISQLQVQNLRQEICNGVSSDGRETVRVRLVL